MEMRLLNMITSSKSYKDGIGDYEIDNSFTLLSAKFGTTCVF